MLKSFHFSERGLPSIEHQGQNYYRIHGIDRAVVGSRHLFFSSDVDMARDFTGGALLLNEGEWISTGTLRNSLFLEPWARLTRLRDLRLWVDCEGALNVKILCARSGKKPRVFKEMHLLSRLRGQHLIEVGSPSELPENSRLYWSVEALEDNVCLHDVSFVTHSVPLGDCRLMVLLRTYGRTIDAKGILQRFAEAGRHDPFYDSLLEHIHFALLDTTPGCDPEYREPWQQDLNIEIIVSENLGGGGNAGHLLKLLDEACRKENRAPTELLILDDDLSISPESLARYFMFCAYRHQEVICSAPVLMKSRPTVVWEDGGFWGRLNFQEGGGFDQKRNLFPNLLKHGLQVDSFDGLDAFNPLNPCEYSTFIFFGLPMTAFRKLGYPASFFLRGDDIEYSLRAQQLSIPLITNPNVTAWHEPSHSYGQEYMAILHGVIINLTYSSHDAGYYVRFFEERLYEHASIEDAVGISLYQDILAQLTDRQSKVLTEEFHQHYADKLKAFGAIKMVTIQDAERAAFERQAKENGVLLVPFIYPGYQKDAPKYRSVVVFNQPAKCYRQVTPVPAAQKMQLIKDYLTLLTDFESRFDEIRQHWQQRLAATQTDVYWTSIREKHRAATRTLFTARKAHEEQGRKTVPPPATAQPEATASRNHKWLGKLRAAVERTPAKPDAAGTSSRDPAAGDNPLNELPEDFDPAVYLHINQDVVNSGIDPSDHYLRFGRREGRRYKLGR